jgi:hypothetical protein
MRTIVFDGLYPSNPLFNLSWLLIIVFEIVVCCIEVGLIDWYICRKFKLPPDSAITYSLTFIVVVANVVTFAFGVFLQILMQW